MWIVCGNCGETTLYPATRYEMILQDDEVEQTAPFYFSPSYRTAKALLCPKCNRMHHNGQPINGENSYRCLGCGEVWRPTIASEDSRTDWLKKASTRQLLTLLNTVRAYGNYPDDFYNFSVEELKAELATREHVPNKQEAKELRRKKAQGRG